MDPVAILQRNIAQKREEVRVFEQQVKLITEKQQKFPAFKGKTEHDFKQWSEKKQKLDVRLKDAKTSLRHARMELDELNRQRQLPMFPHQP